MMTKLQMLVFHFIMILETKTKIFVDSKEYKWTIAVLTIL